MNVDVEAERLAGNLTILDATATLGKFMVGDSPDSRAVHAGRGQPHRIASARAANRWVKVRAYGEMVDLLWQGANHAAAIALEEMWTDLGAHLSVRSAVRLRDGGVLRRGRPARASARSAASTRTSRSPRRADGSTDASGATGGVDQRSQPSRDAGRGDRAAQAGRAGACAAPSSELRAGGGRRTRAGRARPSSSAGRSQRDRSASTSCSSACWRTICARRWPRS